MICCCSSVEFVRILSWLKEGGYLIMFETHTFGLNFVSKT